MDDIRRMDRALFVKELLRPHRIFLMLCVAVPSMAGAVAASSVGPLLFLLIAAAIYIVTSSNEAARKRFIDKKFKQMWQGCVDRLERFDEVLKTMRREQIADLQEMPKTIHSVSDSIYCALRRADMIAHEVERTERDLHLQPPAFHVPSHDAQAKELYRIADKNIAEYRSYFAGVMAGVHRAEAQAAVYITTLDSLRMKMIGYRLVGKSPEMSSHDFLEAMSEAKLQLQAIDKALDELDLGPYPKMIAVMPPEMPPDVRERLEQVVKQDL